MSLLSFIKSKTFLKQIAIMAIIVLALTIGLMKWLSVTTNHGEELVVPNLLRLKLPKVTEKLQGVELEYVLIDSVDFRSDFPPLTVVEQDPRPGDKVKKNRKIYIKINSSSYGLIAVPNLIQISYRQAEPTLNALGLSVGQVTYKANIGKDMVLGISQNGRNLKPGDKVKKMSKIDIVLGDGNPEGIVTEEEKEQNLIDQIIEDTNSF